MIDIRIDEFAERCDGLNGNMDFQYVSVSPSIEFSNTGRRGGKKYFSISMVDLIQTLKDIKENIAEFAGASTYDETRMRNLFSRFTTSQTVNALSTVQTLPLYGVIAKVIHLSNEEKADFNEKSILLDSDKFDVAIAYLESQLPDNDEYLEGLSPSISNEDTAINIIYYGAPGVGKSYKIDQICDDNNSIRTIFHPETQSSDFIGCLKPKMNGHDVIYEFRPGPFTKAIVSAYSNPEKHQYLIIEEINRAAAAAVFGEVFQLLDRAADSSSVYPIDVIDPDMLHYLESNSPSSINEGKLKIPSNLSLYATMNSSDQAVMPMDTAFKRRWLFEYVPIDFSECPEGILSIPIREQDNIEVNWSDFAQVINAALEDKSIPEDRLLGPWFIAAPELATQELAEKSLKGKLCLYLWDDVLRHNQHNIIFDNDIKSYGQLVSSFESRMAVFAEHIELALLDKVTDVTEDADSDDQV
ncbi:AAA family ATPase [Psychrobium sp. nBUS_13]|uniref:AAA family ATPase n=1 Tax=Psychrobium sp. nBUS_13 TaxID=3395319 RepID=UPI003EB81AA7